MIVIIYNNYNLMGTPYNILLLVGSIISILFGFAIPTVKVIVGLGIKANLKNPKIHWLIEISNVMCQGLVAMATIMLF